MITFLDRHGRTIRLTAVIVAAIIAVLVQLDATPITRLSAEVQRLGHDRADQHLTEDLSRLRAIGNLIDVAHDAAGGKHHVGIVGNRGVKEKVL